MSTEPRPRLTLTKKMKWLLAAVPFALIVLAAGYEGARVWWYRGFSRGARTGVVRNVVVTGPPFCKHLEGELVIDGGNKSAAEIWKFSADDESDTNPIVLSLEQAEKTQRPVTLDYRQDKGALFRCADIEYFVTKVEP